MLHTPLPEEAERIFSALSENGSVEMPLQETFWALRFGTLIDQFGIPWAINCGYPPKINQEVAPVASRDEPAKQI
jgi:uncharacterized glyoxalase superfamily protein PhnB